MIEVLTALETEEDYTKYRSIVKKNITDTDEKRLMDNVDKWYRYGVESHINWADFEVWFFVQNPAITGDKKALFEAMFQKLQITSGSYLSEELIATFITRTASERIAFLALEVAEGKKDTLEDVQLEFDTYLHQSGMVKRFDTQIVTVDLDEIYSTFITGDGLNWRLNALNESLGPLRKSNLVFVAARPETGKTSLLCSEATHMATQLGSEKTILYFSNEEHGSRVQARLISSALGVDAPTIVRDTPTYAAQYKTYMGGNMQKITVIHDANLSLSDIEYWLNQYDVGLIIIDQLRKVRGLDKLDGVTRLERLFQTARGWSDSYAPVLACGQLGDEAEGKQYPGMNTIYESRTAIQGECDAVVLIGKIDGSVPQETRFLNIPKNKLPTPGDISMRHGKHEVLLLPEIGRFI